MQNSRCFTNGHVLENLFKSSFNSGRAMEQILNWNCFVFFSFRLFTTFWWIDPIWNFSSESNNGLVTTILDHWHIVHDFCKMKYFNNERAVDNFFLMLALLKRASFWPPSMVYISFINFTNFITNYNPFMLELCGQLSCTASTYVFQCDYMIPALLRVCPWLYSNPVNS